MPEREAVPQVTLGLLQTLGCSGAAVPLVREAATGSTGIQHRRKEGRGNILVSPRTSGLGIRAEPQQNKTYLYWAPLAKPDEVQCSAVQCRWASAR
jgi:hypothetical protein